MVALSSVPGITNICLFRSDSTYQFVSLRVPNGIRDQFKAELDAAWAQDDLTNICLFRSDSTSIVASVTLTVSGKWSLIICMYRLKKQFNRYSSSQCSSKYNGV